MLNLDKKLAAEEKQEFGSGILTWDQAAALGSPPPGHTWAQYDGKCAGCGQWFPAGSPIRMSHSAGGWVGATCC